MLVALCVQIIPARPLFKKMDEGLFRKIVHDAILIEPLPSIKLSLNGEPLLDERIVAKIMYIKDSAM
jgi:hypothetical protein